MIVKFFTFTSFLKIRNGHLITPKPTIELVFLNVVIDRLTVVYPIRITLI